MKNLITSFKSIAAIGIVVIVGIVLAFVILHTEKRTIHDSHGEAELHRNDSNYAKGPHGGRLLSEGDFQVEITIYERGVPPQFRVYAFDRGKLVNPDEVKLTIELRRLGGKVDVINFQREGDYLRGDKVVEEPHSLMSRC